MLNVFLSPLILLDLQIFSLHNQRWHWVMDQGLWQPQLPVLHEWKLQRVISTYTKWFPRRDIFHHAGFATFSVMCSLSNCANYAGHKLWPFDLAFDIKYILLASHNGNGENMMGKWYWGWGASGNAILIFRWAELHQSGPQNMPKTVLHMLPSCNGGTNGVFPNPIGSCKEEFPSHQHYSETTRELCITRALQAD